MVVFEWVGHRSQGQSFPLSPSHTVNFLPLLSPLHTIQLASQTSLKSLPEGRPPERRWFQKQRSNVSLPGSDLKSPRQSLGPRLWSLSTWKRQISFWNWWCPILWEPHNIRSNYLKSRGEGGGLLRQRNNNNNTILTGVLQLAWSPRESFSWWHQPQTFQSKTSRRSCHKS